MDHPAARVVSPVEAGDGRPAGDRVGVRPGRPARSNGGSRGPFLAAAAVLAAVLGLVGCGSGDPEGGADGASAAAPNGTTGSGEAPAERRDEERARPEAGESATLAESDDADDADEPNRRDAMAVLAARPLAEMPDDWGAFEPLLVEVAEEAWPRSVVARDEFDEVVAVVDGIELTGADLAKELVLRFGLEPLEGLLADLVALAEAEDRGIRLTEEEIDAAVASILNKSRLPNAEQYFRRFSKSEARLRLEAKAEASRRAAFAQDKGREEFKEKDALDYIVWHRALAARYPTAPVTEYGYDRIPEGAIAEIHGKPVPIELTVPYVLSFLLPAEREVSLDDVIDATLMNRELERRGIRVAPEEVDQLVARHERMTAGGIPWRALIESKRKFNRLNAETVGFLRRRFELWIALDRIQGPPTEAEIVAYFNRNQPMIGRASVKLQTIRFPIYHPTSGEPLDPFRMAEVKIAMEKALEALRGGMDFNEAVMEFSRDPETRRMTDVNGRRIAGDLGATNIRDGVIDESIAGMAFLARPGEWIGPIRSRRSYDIIRPYWNRPPATFPYEDEAYTDLNENGAFDPGEPWDDFNGNGRWDFGRRHFALNELVLDRGLEFLAELRERAEIEILD